MYRSTNQLANGMYLVTCRKCRMQFASYSYHSKNCDSCRSERKLKEEGKLEKHKRRSVKKRADDMVKCAAKMGVTYGKYMAIKDDTPEKLELERIKTICRTYGVI